MKAEQFICALGEIGDVYLDEAISAPQKRPRLRWLEYAACACIVIALSLLIGYGLLPGSTPPEFPTVVITPPTQESEDPTVTTTEADPSTLPPTEPSTEESSEITEPSHSTVPSTEPTTEPPIPTEPSTTEIIDIPPALPTLPPMLCVNGVLYELQPGLSAEADYIAQLSLLGTVLSCCSEEEYPDAHLEANEPITGAEVYADGDRMIVLVNGAVRVYVAYVSS